jgi:phage terminase small subunit
MQQRGRKSAAALSVVRVDGSSEKLRPRANCSAAVRAIFNEICAQLPSDHFRPTDAPLLEQYCQAIALARQAFEQLEVEGPVIAGRTSPWIVVLEKAHRSSVALSMRLRLSPQQRVDPKTVGRRSAGAGISAADYLSMQENDE